MKGLPNPAANAASDLEDVVGIEIIRALETAMTGEKSRLPIECRDLIWECIRLFLDHPRPSSDRDGKASPYDLFISKKEVFISSPSNDEDENGILQLWHDSNQGVLETQCPNTACGAWQVLEWERMDLESAKVACIKCGEHFGQYEWNRGEEFLRWRFDRPEHESTMFPNERAQFPLARLANQPGQ